MPQETIKFTIKQDGTVTEEVIGVYGSKCEELTKRVEEQLGNVQYREPTAEMYRASVKSEQQQIMMKDFIKDL